MRDISHLYGEPPGTIYNDYFHADLEEIAERAEDNMLKILDVSERRAIRQYFQHRRGEITFSSHWLPGIESAIAKIEAEFTRRENLRLVVFNNDTELYWAGMGVFVEPWCKTKARALLFMLSYRDFLEELCDRTNKAVGYSKRLVVVEIDAFARLAKHRF